MSGLQLRHLTAIGKQYGFPVPDAVPNPWTGATSYVYPVGNVVIKVAFDAPNAIAAVTTDAVMNPVARNLGVSTSELLAFDDTMDVVPVPIALYRRVQGAVPLQQLSGPPSLIEQAWYAVGREIARLHAVPETTPMPISLRTFRQSPEVDPRPWLDELLQRGLVTGPDAAWLHRLLGVLAPSALEEVPLRLCHGDMNGSNVLVSRVSGSTCTLIDWAGTGWLDPVWDFAAVPLSVVPYMLAGHRAIGPLPHDATAEARICWCQVQTRLLNAHSQMDVASTRIDLARDLHQIRTFSSLYLWNV